MYNGAVFGVGRLPEQHRQGQGGSYAAASRLTLYKEYRRESRRKPQATKIQNNLKKIQKSFQNQLTIFATLNL